MILYAEDGRILEGWGADLDLLGHTMEEALELRVFARTYPIPLTGPPRWWQLDDGSENPRQSDSRTDDAARWKQEGDESMTEPEWLVCTDVRRMLTFLRGNLSERKRRLFGIGCCRRLWPLVSDDRSLRAVEIAERYADGFGSEQDVDAAHRAACEVANSGATSPPAAFALWTVAYATSIDAAFFIETYLATLPDTEEAFEAPILRDVVGNPFRPVALDSAWRTPTVMALADAIYEHRRFDDLPVLADALEEAGCTDAGILDHCRGPGPHVRGCWIVDLLTGRG
jgi:hypothetical protein